VKLRFSKSGDENIEQQYATHYVAQQKVDEAKERRTIRSESVNPDATTEEL
jgi:hypothetical protein